MCSKSGIIYVRCVAVITFFYKRHTHICGTRTTVPNIGAGTSIRTHTQTRTQTHDSEVSGELCYLLNKLLKISRVNCHFVMDGAGLCTGSTRSAIPRVQQHNQLRFPSQYSALHCLLATTCSHIFYANALYLSVVV